MQDIKTDIETIKKSVVSKIKSQREKRIVLSTNEFFTTV
jgi:hypothetical protein